ncbi:MAG: hypothetical protein ACHQ2Z_11840 [Elusimicrobiota bacterium]
MLFSKPIDRALSRVIPAEMSPDVSLYVKLTIFTAALACGEAAQFIKFRAPGDWPPELLNAMAKAIIAPMIAASGMLLAVFGTALAVYSSMRARGDERPAAGAERRPPAAERQVGAERHARAKDRQGTEEAGRYL